jgi:hypothetical protein
MQRRLGSPIALVTEMDRNGRLLVVYNAHLESRSMGRIQMAQLDEILADKQEPPSHSHLFAQTPVLWFRIAQVDKIARTHPIMMALDWIFASSPFTWIGGTVRHDRKGSDTMRFTRRWC